MDDKKRRSYLESMGIQLWFPKVELPNAKPGPLRRPTIPVEEVSASDPETEPGSTGVRMKADATGTRSGSGTDPSTGDDNKVSAVVAENVEPFKLCMVYSDPGICVAFEIPLQDRELNSRYLTLVEDISSVLGSRNPKRTIAFQQWPIIQNRNVPQSEVDALLVIQGKLKQLIGDTPTKLVIMGNVAARYLSAEARNFKYKQNQHVADFSNTVAVVTQGIDELLQDPIQKRNVWTKINPLINADE